MSKIISIIKSLPDLLALTPASQSEISDAEIQLCLHFADEYKIYLGEFGAALADGVELTGLTKAEHRNVVLATKREWNLNSQVPHNLYVIENISIDGIVIWQDANGDIYQSTPHNSPIKIANSLSDYLNKG